MANRKLVAEQGNLGTYEIDVKDGDKSVKARFDGCKSWQVFDVFVAGLSKKAAEGEMSQMEDAFERYIYGMDLRARAAARESVAAESTVVTRGKQKIDIMDIPVERACAAINNAYADVALLGGEVGKAFVASRRKLIEAGKVTETNGLLAVKK